MKIAYFGLTAMLFASALAPLPSLAAAPKTFSGTVIKINPSGVVITNGTAATYNVDFYGATLTRKNGSAMVFSDVLVGDKIQVTGTLHNDNSISAQSIRDLSLYAHSGTFTGKVTSINPGSMSFTLQSSGSASNQTIATNNFTSFKKNNGSAAYKDLELGMSVTVKGLWDRTTTQITASQVLGTLRLVNISFSGTLWGVNGNSLTVIGNGNVIYGVNLTNGKLLDKSGKAMPISKLVLGDIVSVKGEHVSGSVKINAFSVKVTKPAKS